MNVWILLVVALGQAPQMVEPPSVPVADSAGRVAGAQGRQPEPPGGWSAWPADRADLSAGVALESYRGLPWGSSYAQAKAWDATVGPLRPVAFGVARVRIVVASDSAGVPVMRGDLIFLDGALARVEVIADERWSPASTVGSDLAARYGATSVDNRLQGRAGFVRRWDRPEGRLEATMVIQQRAMPATDSSVGLAIVAAARMNGTLYGEEPFVLRLIYTSTKLAPALEARLIWAEMAERRTKL